jgi:hypothetical protein
MVLAVSHLFRSVLILLLAPYLPVKQASTEKQYSSVVEKVQERLAYE